MLNSDFSKIRVEAKASTLDMMIGPPLLSAVLSGILTIAVAPHIQKHLNFLWLFPIFFVPLLSATFYYNLNRGRWLIENGVVYRGKKPLFRLDEIEAVQIGLPDNWYHGDIEAASKNTRFRRNGCCCDKPSGVNHLTFDKPAMDDVVGIDVHKLP